MQPCMRLMNLCTLDVGISSDVWRSLNHHVMFCSLVPGICDYHVIGFWVQKGGFRVSHIEEFVSGKWVKNTIQNYMLCCSLFLADD